MIAAMGEHTCRLDKDLYFLPLLFCRSDFVTGLCGNGLCTYLFSDFTVELISSITKVLSGSNECEGYRVTQHDESVSSSLQL